MLIKLTPPASAAPTPTILFCALLARLAADDLEAPPALHALDRAAVFPSLLSEVLFDLTSARVTCAFLDGASEEWDLGPRCAEMLGRRAVEAERARAEREVQEKQQQEEREKAREKAERLREAELEREYEEKMQSLRAKGKGNVQSLNSPPPSPKGADRPKGRLHRSKSLLMALVALLGCLILSRTDLLYQVILVSELLIFVFSVTPNTRIRASVACYLSAALPFTPCEHSRAAPPSRPSHPSCGQMLLPPPHVLTQTHHHPHQRNPHTRARVHVRIHDLAPPPPYSRPSPPPPPPPPPPADPFQTLDTPPGSANSSAFSGSISGSGQPQRVRPRPEGMSPRALRRRARSTLVDTFRAHVLPQLGARIALFEPAGSAPAPAPQPRLVTDDGDEERDTVRARGGGYHAWVARSMLRRASMRMRELEAEWPGLDAPRRLRAASSGSEAFSPSSTGFPSSPVSPRQLTFEPWSSDESGGETGSEDEGSETDMDAESEGGRFGFVVGDIEDADADESDSDDGSSVHTPESGHSIGYGHPPRRASGSSHVQEVSGSTTSSYFTCADDEEPRPTISHIRGPARASGSSTGARDREQRERKRAGRAARAEHAAFVSMTARLRRLLAQGSATRSMSRIQRAEAERVREGRGVRRAWLDKKGVGAGVGVGQAQAFRPSGLRFVWGSPPAYEDVVLHPTVTHPMRRTRPTRVPMPVQRALAHLEFELDCEDNTDMEAAACDDGLDMDLENLDLTDALDIEGMALVVDGDLELDEELGFPHAGGLGIGVGGVDVFADVGSGKARQGVGPARSVGAPEGDCGAGLISPHSKDEHRR
ncbi:hypothetical protein MSAN_02233900 [Mycena sanguinolenta]|uniref:Uncharacterized protein n=1 Tax=Mycena sanguinolenta TaxID=230812 RepID=A0A8H6XBQ0_9AGAR|nr:hypothetical protein MSAN_02233900 [Mycena sanguinolenta]